jgi:hypothetical protein
MILIGATLPYVVFTYGRNIVTTMLSGIFCAGSCCLSLRSYFNGGCVELIKMNCLSETKEASLLEVMKRLKKSN